MKFLLIGGSAALLGAKNRLRNALSGLVASMRTALQSEYGRRKVLTSSPVNGFTPPDYAHHAWEVAEELGSIHNVLSLALAHTLLYSSW